MARPISNVPALIDRLRHLVSPRPTASAPASDDRILDAALAAFSANGIRAATMSDVARRAGVSREWIYKRFGNRDQLILAVARREAGHLVTGLVEHAAAADDVEPAIVDGFVYAVEFLRGHPVVQKLSHSDNEAVNLRMLRDAGPILGVGVTIAAEFLTAFGGLHPRDAAAAAETLVRLGATLVVIPSGGLDLEDHDALERFVASAVRAALATNAEAPG
jgi:AcrR family transcriptional regulator